MGRCRTAPIINGNGCAVSEDDVDRNAKLPRETTSLFGHSEQESILLEAYKTGRMPHAWLIGGPPGIGKATLAFRLARFILAYPDNQASSVQQATSLAVDEFNPVTRRIAAQAHGDLLVLERALNEQTGNLYTVIRVEDVRRTVAFFGSTSNAGGWRIAIVDSVDDLQREGANTLLKILEEPPERSLLLLMSHAPGRELATIRSRCRRLLLRPLHEDDVTRALAAATGCDPRDTQILNAATAAEGSVGRAMQLFDGQALALRQRVSELLNQLPDPDLRELHALGDALGGTDPQTLTIFMDLINGWLSSRLARETHELNRDLKKLARVAETYEKINHHAREVDAYNLERKPFVFSVFNALANDHEGR
jgi:DNA polymerase III subunit delta'